VATIWFCPTCRVGVRVPDDAPTSRVRYRCPRCRHVLSFDDRRTGSSPEVLTDVEAVEEDVPEVEPVGSARWADEAPPARRAPARHASHLSRRPRPKRRPTGIPVWVWLVAAGVGLLALVLAIVLAVVLSRGSPSTSASPQTAGQAAAWPDAGPLILPAPLSGLNLANQDQLQKGMSQAEVERILGGPGKVLSREKIGFPPLEVERKCVRWEDGRGGHLQVTFDDDRLNWWDEK
jgi:hypothetical protein